MKAISLWQPWASLLVHGEKKVETRSWRFPLCLPCVLAIHAAKKWDRQLSEMSWHEPFRSALERCGIENRDVPLGVIVGVVRLTGCHRTEEMGVGTTERAFGDYSRGRWAWVCDAFFKPAAPIQLRGRQGLFDWEPPSDLILPDWAKDAA